MIILGCSSAVGEAPGKTIATLDVDLLGNIIFTGDSSPFTPL
tara:strand:- start:114 stop:239 length:126 start_codon:yes stop_codon:yes gene_type:complete